MNSVTLTVIGCMQNCISHNYSPMHVGGTICVVIRCCHMTDGPTVEGM